MTSDAHAGLLAAIGATLPAASWHLCRTHYATNLMAITPKSSWPWVRTLLYSVYDQPDARSVEGSLSTALKAASVASILGWVRPPHRLRWGPLLWETGTPRACPTPCWTRTTTSLRWCAECDAALGGTSILHSVCC